MAALHDALKSLGPFDFSETPHDNLKGFLSNAFCKGQLLVDSVPIPAPADSPVSSDSRSRSVSNASSASEISLSSARPTLPPPDVEALQKEWKSVKMNPRDNPLGMSVYKLGGKDGKGAWFARRSVHEGLGFTKWKRALEKEFPETLKAQGGPGVGNIRGIGGEKRVVYKNVDETGKLEVYLLSAQFPGPTTPRDFVTMFLTSDQCLSNTSGLGEEIPRHFMVISRPCLHPDTPPRDGYIRGQYESVEFIREIPRKKGPGKSTSALNLQSQVTPSRRRSASTLSRDAIVRNAKQNHPFGESSLGGLENEPISETDLTNGGSRARGHTISFDKSRGSDAKGEHMDIDPEEDENESNPIEWIMITRSDPGGSVPRFMIERGTPGGIVADASKFLDWACARNSEDFESDGFSDEGELENVEGEKPEKHEPKHHHHHEKDLANWQTNGHLAGIQEMPTAKSEQPPFLKHPDTPEPTNGSGLYAMVAGAAGLAGGYIASHTPQMISDRLPAGHVNSPPPNVYHETPATPESSFRRSSISTVSSVSSTNSFTSALERRETENADASSQQTTNSESGARTMTRQDKELQKLEEKKNKLDDKLSKAREKELSKKGEDSAREEEAIKRAEEKHEKEVKRREEKYKKEVEKLEKKKEREARKVEERKRKAEEKDEKTRLQRQLGEYGAEIGLLRKEKELLRSQVGELQAENTALAIRVGRLGIQGEEVLRGFRAEVGKSGRSRASSLKGLVRSPSLKSSDALSGGSSNSSNSDLKENKKLVS